MDHKFDLDLPKKKKKGQNLQLSGLRWVGGKYLRAWMLTVSQGMVVPESYRGLDSKGEYRPHMRTKMTGKDKAVAS